MEFGYFESNQEPEMAEISGTYDPQPALPTLKQYSATAIAFQALRCEVNKYRTENELEKFNPRKLHDSLSKKLPDLPTAINDMIEKYVKKLGHSVENWLQDHYEAVFFCHYGRRNYILYDFVDFVGDFTGGIDFVKTAERMMHYDRFSDAEKFKVACMYYFEDDVRRIWPSVWKQVGLDQIGVDFDRCPLLYYWICCLSNELDKIPIDMNANNSIDEQMFDVCFYCNRAAREYFWNRLSPEIQVRVAENYSYRSDELSFVNLILPKLDDQQLEEFVSRRGCEVILSLMAYARDCETYFLQAWMRMKNVMNEDKFGELIVKMLQLEGKRYGSYSFEDYWLNRFREVWSSSSHNLRMSVIKNILPSLRLFESSDRDLNFKLYNKDFISSQFLLTILSDVSLKERNSFWCNCWHDLIRGKNFDDLQRIMEMCFENNDKIIQYKQNVMAGSENVREMCVSLLTRAFFEELDDLVNYCSPDEDSAKHYKQQLLQSMFLGERSIFRYTYLKRAKQFDKFISDTYGSADLANQFKNQLMSTPATQLILPKEAFSSRAVNFKEFIEFMELFVSTEEMMQQKKTCILHHLNEVKITNPYDLGYSYCGSLFNEVLLWCLGSENKVAEFIKYSMR